MWLYLIIFFIPVVAYAGMRETNARNVTFLAIFIAALALFVGMSDMFGGYDRYIYAEVFDGIANTTDGGYNYLLSGSFEAFESEKGWTVLNILISFYTANRYIFILTITLITYALLVDIKDIIVALTYIVRPSHFKEYRIKRWMKKYGM